MVLGVKPTPTPMANTPLHSIPCVCRTWPADEIVQVETDTKTTLWLFSCLNKACVQGENVVRMNDRFQQKKGTFVCSDYPHDAGLFSQTGAKLLAADFV